VHLLQSQEINLGRYLEKRVTVEGAMSDPMGNAKPVLNVTAIHWEGGDLTGKWNSYENTNAGFKFEYPETWELSEGVNQVTLRSEGQEVLAVNVFATSALAEDFVEDREEGEGTAVTVGAQKSLRYAEEKSIRFYVPNPSKRKIYKVAFTFSGSDENEKEEKEIFYDLMKTFTPLYFKRPTGERCAGAAKLKCDEGFRCELSSTDKNAVGVCVSLSATADDATCPFVPTPENCENYQVSHFSVNGCPTRYICVDEGMATPVSTPINITRVMDTATKYKDDLLETDSAEILRFEITESQNLMAIVYKVKEQEFKTLFAYSPSGNEFNFIRRAHLESAEGDGWTLLSGEDLQKDLEKQVIYAGD
ncbi:MAG: hypothetical protein V1760_01150, partial [Candidatus Peregrinibacteria bacterium]